MGRSILWTILGTVLLVMSCGDRTTARLNVLVIGVDTLRPDHLGCYGYSRPTSPNIDGLASEGVLCERTVSQAPWTLPSFATVFTSLYPSQHGAVRLSNGLRDSVPTLAEILKQHGYRTGAVINAPTLKPATRVNRGFDHYSALRLDERLADGTTRDALEWIDESGGPFFMFAHYFDPHRPYAPPPPFHRKYDPDYCGPIGDSFDLEGFSLVKSEMSRQMEVLTAEDWAHIVALYDGEITFADREIGTLLSGLASRGLRRNTLIVFLSDHGEEFFEHHCYGHGHSLYDELIKVPLIFSLPGILPADVRITRQVRLVDVAPTILDLLGLDSDACFEGVSLKPLMDGRPDGLGEGSATLSPDLAFSESISQGPELKCIVKYPWKMVYNMVTQETRLFRLDIDPGECSDVARTEAGNLALLEGALFPALFEFSETWYVEVAGAPEGSQFDVTVTARRDDSIGRIHPYRLFDRAGRIVDASEVTVERASGSILQLTLSDLQGTCRLAFQVNPGGFPIEIDIGMDGRHTVKRVHIGQDPCNPKDLPILFKGKRRRVRCPCRPAFDSEPPYALIWLDEAAHAGEVLVTHDERTKNEFRALGYVQ
jgi:choline-sulfatase